jgi:redox-sensitive bicupin YhaK (pirin superfamily)
MITIRKSGDRGHADHGWLDTYHTFSFNTYYDNSFMGFRSLRVINDDRIAPGKGFGSHPHQDMEIITYVLDGALQHRDNMGNGSVIRPGDVQRMSAGTGIIHSEFNASDKEPVHLLQIWIIPNVVGVTPSYQEKSFRREDKLGRLCLIASESGRNGAVKIHQDAQVYASLLEPGMEIAMPIAEGRHVWLHLATGEIRLGEHTLKAGDGVAITGEASISITGGADSELLLFDLA